MLGGSLVVRYRYAATMSTEVETHSETVATVLFLCTGNYYRSRFAEELFNHLAARRQLPVRSTSRGFSPSPEFNPGSISEHTLRALRALGIEAVSGSRLPRAVDREDFLRHAHWIAFSETEHRPMMEQLFPEFAGKVTYWHIEDLDWESPEMALAKIERNVRHLLDRLPG